MAGVEQDTQEYLEASRQQVAAMQDALHQALQSDMPEEITTSMMQQIEAAQQRLEDMEKTDKAVAANTRATKRKQLQQMIKDLRERAGQIFRQWDEAAQELEALEAGAKRQKAAKPPTTKAVEGPEQSPKMQEETKEGSNQNPFNRDREQGLKSPWGYTTRATEAHAPKQTTAAEVGQSSRDNEVKPESLTPRKQVVPHSTTVEEPKVAAYANSAVREPYNKPAAATMEQSPARDMQAMAAIGSLVIAAAASHLPPSMQGKPASTPLMEEMAGAKKEEAAIHSTPEETAARIGTAINSSKNPKAAKAPNTVEPMVEALNLLGHPMQPEVASAKSSGTPLNAESAADSSANIYDTATSEIQGHGSSASNVWSATPKKQEVTVEKASEGEEAQGHGDGQGEAGGP